MLTADELKEAKEIYEHYKNNWYGNESLNDVVVFYPKLLSHIEAQNKIIEVMREALQRVNCNFLDDDCPGCFTKDALEQADKIAKGVGK